MKRSRFFVFHPLWLAAALLAGLMLALTMTSARALPESPLSPADVPGGIEGILYEPDGTTPVAYGWIDIYDAEGQPWMGTDTDEPTGYFSIPNLPPGGYVLQAYPPDGSIYAASVPTDVEVLSGQWTSVTLHLTEVKIDGYVYDCISPTLRLEWVDVVVHNDDWTFELWDTTNISGEFKFGGVVSGTTYFLEAFPPFESEYAPSEPITVTPIVSDVALSLCVPPTSVVGIVQDYTGAPVPGAGVVIGHDEHWEETSTDASGNFFFRGLPPGEFWIQAAPPWGVEDLIASEPFTLVVTMPPTVTNVGIITLPQAVKAVTGHVKLVGSGAVVTDALVVAHRLDAPGYADTPVDPTGAFTLSVPGGEWHVRAEPLPPPAPPAEWIFPDPPVWIAFTLPLTETEVITSVLLEVVPTDAHVIGNINCPGTCVGQGLNQWDVWVELRNDTISVGAEPGVGFLFNIPVPHGWYELVIHVEHPTLQGPEPVPVFVGPGSVYNVGTIWLLEKDAKIKGRVRNQLGHGVEGVPVVGWQPEEFGWGWVETDASGYYTMPVTGGEWFVEPHPGLDMPYVYRDHPKLVHVLPGGTMAGVDFTLTMANAVIEGTAVDAGTGGRIWGLDGWAGAGRYVGPGQFELFSDAPMWDGGFELRVRSGYTYHVGVDLPPQAPYVSGETGPVLVVGSSVTVAVPLEPKNAAIQGQLVEAGTSTPAVGAWAEIIGEDGSGNWTSVLVDADTADYWMDVISGAWRLRAWVDPASGYVAVPTTTLVTVQSGSVETQTFEVWPIGTLITGTVLQPDGAPFTPTTFVFAEGRSPHIGYFETFTETDGSGNFALPVPAGTYVVGAGLPGEELKDRHWLNPPPIEDVTTTPVTLVVGGLELRFRQLDGLITGTVTFASAGVTPTHPAYVWGWAESGEWAETKAPVISGTMTFTYAMWVISDTVWHVGAVYDDWDNGYYYESPEAVAPVLPPDGRVEQDLVLGSPQSLPQPFIVSFDASQMQTIVLPDGTELGIPPGAMAISGTVTLFIFPTQEMRPEPGHELIGAGYEMWVIDQDGQEITQFNKNVIITFHYPPDAILRQRGISEYKLVPVYYSTLVGHWILADSYVVDTVNNEITLQVDHFSRFSVRSVAASAYSIYLPLVFRNYGG